MPSLTLPDGSQKNVAASNFVRFRSALNHEIGGKDGTVLFKPRLSVLESLDSVAAAMLVEVKSFVTLTSPNGAPHWVDAVKSGDAEKPRNTEKGPNTSAVVQVGGVRLRVRDKVDVTQALLDAGRAAATS